MCALSLRDDLGAGALNDGEKFFLFLVRDLKPVERGFEVTKGGIELRIADAHPSVRGFQVFAVVMRRPAGGKDDELNQMFFQVRYVPLGRVPSDGLVAPAME